MNYIISNYDSIKSILELNIGSSMESHISHLIASLFSARPKGFSTKRITKYLKLNDYKNNNININLIILYLKIIQKVIFLYLMKELLAVLICEKIAHFFCIYSHI